MPMYFLRLVHSQIGQRFRHLLRSGSASPCHGEGAGSTPARCFLFALKQGVALGARGPKARLSPDLRYPGSNPIALTIAVESVLVRAGGCYPSRRRFDSCRRS